MKSANYTELQADTRKHATAGGGETQETVEK